MPTNIDDKELARLEALAEKAASLPFEDMAADGWGYVVVDILPAVTTAVPALVAEVRRLRAELGAYIDEDQTKVITLQRKIMDVLRDKVEAWEWWDEVDHLYDDAVWSFELRQCAIDELYATLTAAREAVHADRE